MHHALLAKFASGPTGQAVGFADDATLIVTGPHIETLLTLGQKAINKALTYGWDSGLKFAAAKTVAVLSTQKYRTNTFELELRMGEDHICFESKVKYLGIYLDSKIHFNAHIEQKISKAKQFMFAIKKAVRGQLPPHLMLWIYQAMIRPLIVYRSITWSKVATKAANKAKLDRLQRPGLSGLTSIAHTTPSTGLKAVLGIKPLDLHIIEMALNVHL